MRIGFRTSTTAARPAKNAASKKKSVRRSGDSKSGTSTRRASTVRSGGGKSGGSVRKPTRTGGKSDGTARLGGSK